MKTPRIYIGALAVFCIAALVIGTSGAAAATPQGTTNNFKEGTGQFGPEKILDNLTAQGYDVSAIRTAVTSGDFETAHTLMQEFRTAHPDAFPTRGEGAGKGPMTGEAKGERMILMLDNLTAQGYDVSSYPYSSDKRGLRDCSYSHAGVQDCSSGCISRTPVNEAGTVT